jgi:hypothetical protein
MSVILEEPHFTDEAKLFTLILMAAQTLCLFFKLLYYHDF